MSQSALPLFYEKPEPLQAARHAGLRLAPNPSYTFSRRAVSVPISALESPLVGRHYPIVFSAAQDGLPLAVLGLRRDENLFVDEAGSWAEGLHIPAYMRRYPFIFATGEEVERLTLCVDLASERIGTGAGEPLFDEGKPTATTNSALAFCSAFEREMAETRKIMTALGALSLFVPHEANVTLASGSRFEMRDFHVLDAARVEALSDEDFLTLKRAGALPLMFAFFASRPCWGDLVRRLERRGTG